MRTLLFVAALVSSVTACQQQNLAATLPPTPTTQNILACKTIASAQYLQALMMRAIIEGNSVIARATSPEDCGPYPVSALKETASIQTPLIRSDDQEVTLYFNTYSYGESVVYGVSIEMMVRRTPRQPVSHSPTRQWRV